MASDEMLSALKAAVETKRVHARSLLARRNVVACGVGFKESQGQVSEEPCVVVSVTHKVPVSQLAPQDLVPRVLGSIKTDVQAVGVFRAWQPDPKGRHRPAMPGISCGHADVTAGTFGCLVRRGLDLMILSNNHVLADTNRGSRGDPIIQPARFDGGTLSDQIAVLEDWIPLQISDQESECPIANTAAQVLNGVARVLGSSSRMAAFSTQAAENEVDCALARPTDPGAVQSSILAIGTPKGVRVGTLGMQVQKMGRTTGHTTGVINQVDVTVQVDYQGQGVTFVDQFMTTGMSAGGDSGAAVLDMSGYVIGLLFAGSDAATLINPIQAVTSVLNVQVVTG